MDLYAFLDVKNVGYLRSLHTESKKNVIKKTFFFCAFFASVASILRGVLIVQSHHTSEHKIQNGDG